MRQADLTKEAEVEALVAETVAKFGRGTSNPKTQTLTNPNPNPKSHPNPQYHSR